MKAQTANHGKTWHPKPLTVDQRNAIDLLITGKSDQQTADVIGVSRQSVQTWRTTHLIFMSELEQARGNLWRESAERLRGLMSQALTNIAGAVESGDVKASFELLKATHLYGDAAINHIKDWRMPTLIRKAAEAQAQAEGLSEHGLDKLLINLSNDPAWSQRVAALERDLWQEYGEAMD